MATNNNKSTTNSTTNVSDTANHDLVVTLQQEMVTTLGYLTPAWDTRPEYLQVEAFIMAGDSLITKAILSFSAQAPMLDRLEALYLKDESLKAFYDAVTKL